ncbi:DUF5058 family protein [Pragia fontium]|uniref:DUF5058 domain-containing protein n=2 Tax=Pragia fontium TaxID=82985 RepID=A0AAJ4WAT3_9GAMM|nr:DUF5058 family protein [Pragia fontium]AKJ42784.1 hypothetical protein QQ39_12405 [Pragia fontium]SFC87858.1 protein of unknown function [Pragia fontium DSM 5563 = ATCC 49100]SUB83163.1 Uncharacterised protein [Pragia fontium]VEJ56057.1 Uncharacterised protein [Pragia fontium]GKX62338.1 DUF5058 domain-containing protein [Pragia fontium]
MTPEYNEIANSWVLWVAAAPSLFFVFLQACLFFRKSVKTAKALGISDSQVKSAIRGASISSIGPCFMMLSGILTLMLYVGSPIAWLRVDFIGSVADALMEAAFTAQGMGITLGQSELDVNFLCAATIVMTTCGLPFLLFVSFFANKMDKVNKVMSGGNVKLIPIIGGGAMIGSFGALTMNFAYPLGANTVAIIVSAATMATIVIYNRKANLQWLKEWGLTICMIIGMSAAVIAK